MLRAWKLIAAGVAALCLLSLAAELPAQDTSRTKPPVRPAKGNDQDLAAPAPKSRAKTGAPADDGAARPAGARNGNSRTPSADDQPVDGDNESEQPADGSEQRGRQPRPEVDGVLRVQKLPAKLEQILQDWEAASSAIVKLEGNFYRRKYDNVFQVEYWAEGKFVYKAPDSGYYELNGVPANAGVKPKQDANGKAFNRKPDQSEKWVCDGKRVLKINDADKTYEQVDIPEEHQGQNIIDGPLPFLFGMKAEQAKRRYKLMLLDPVKNFPDAFRIKALPQRPEDAANWQQAQVILDPKSFLPLAVILKHPGDSETVHMFPKIQVNQGKGWNPLAGDPFKPNLRGYKRVMYDGGAGPPGDVSQAPKNTTPRTGNNAPADRTSENDRATPRRAPAAKRQ